MRKRYEVRVQTFIDQELQNSLKLYGLRYGLSQSDIMRMALLDFLSAHPLRPTSQPDPLF